MENLVEDGMAAVMAAYRAHVERQNRLYADLPAIPFAECVCPAFGTELAETGDLLSGLTQISHWALNEAG